MSSSPTRDRTCALCIGSSEFSPLDHQGIPQCSASCLIFSSRLILALKKGMPLAQARVCVLTLSLSLGSQHLHAEGNRQETVQSPASGKLLTSTAPFLNSCSTGLPCPWQFSLLLHLFPKEYLWMCVWEGLCWSFCFVWVVWAYILQVDGRFLEGKGSPCTSGSLAHSAQLSIQFRISENSLKW